jgi:hypothetical protein
VAFVAFSDPMRATLALFVASLGLVGCIDDGGQAGTYCRADRDCRGELVCVASACREQQASTPRVDAGPVDSGPVDSGPPPVDARVDSGEPDEDAGTDAGTDAGADAGTDEDAGVDAGD